MSDRREALIGRYRAGSQDRIRRVGLTLIELEEGRGTHAAVEEIARELHTLKGESRMLGFQRISEVAHTAEDTLLAAATGGGLPAPDVCALVLGALEVVAKILRGELTGQDADGQLEGCRDLLRQQAAPRPAAPHAAPGPPAAAPAPTVHDVLMTTAARAVREVTLEGTGARAPAAAAPAPAAAAGSDPGPAAPASGPATPAATRWVQVSVNRVDELCERVAEFESDFRALRSRLVAAFARLSASATATQRALVEDFDRCRGVLDDVSSSAWSLRLVPVEPALEELVHHARELAQELGKRVRMVVRASGAQMERTVLDELHEPLLHLVRNAIDHGIERPDERGDKPPEGLVMMTAEAVGQAVVITITDDGRGIDARHVRGVAVRRGVVTRDVAEAMSEREVFDLLFQHGFTTKAQVSDVSGRGVGLDVVRGKVDALGGSVALSSSPGRTRFTLTLPTTISKERALVMDCGGALYALPSRHVVEVVKAADHPIEQVAGGRTLRYREASIPARSLSATVSVRGGLEEDWVIILESAGRRYAFTTPTIIGEFDLVRRPVDALLAPFDYLAASAAMDDGRLVLVLALAGLVRKSEGRTVSSGPSQRPARRRRVLVVDDSPVIRDLLTEMLVAAGVEVLVASDGSAAMAILDGGQPDLVVSDVEMPGVDGFELLRRIRARWHHLPVVMLTTRNSTSDKQQAATLGADAYLVKSDFQEHTLLETVRRFAGAVA